MSACNWREDLAEKEICCALFHIQLFLQEVRQPIDAAKSAFFVKGMKLFYVLKKGCSAEPLAISE